MPDHISLNATQVIFPMLKVCFVEEVPYDPPLGSVGMPTMRSTEWHINKPKPITMRSMSTKVKLYPGCVPPNWEDLIKPQLIILHFLDGAMLFMMGRGEYCNNELTITPDNGEATYTEPWLITPSYMEDEEDGEDEDEEDEDDEDEE